MDQNCFVFLFVGSSINVWSGYNDRLTEDTFVCSTGLQVLRTLFYAGEPNGGTNENCVRLQASVGFTLVDVSCTGYHEILCEKDAQWVWFSRPVKYPSMEEEGIGLKFFQWELFRMKSTQMSNISNHIGPEMIYI